MIFLGVGWKDGVRHWRSLEGYADRLHGLFVTLPASARVVNRYVRFLYHVGAESLPDAFTRLFARVRAEPERLLGADDTVFMLESLLQRHVYGRPFETKRRPDIRAAVLGLLDALVAGGSSAAFRMRDDFATPLPATP